jgi:hypothetical protein
MNVVVGMQVMRDGISWVRNYSLLLSALGIQLPELLEPHETWGSYTYIYICVCVCVCVCVYRVFQEEEEIF